MDASPTISAPAAIQYAERSTPRRARRWAERVTWILCLYPLLMLALIHLLYVGEWFNNGEQPIPPFHGPHGFIERVLYDLTGVGGILTIPVAGVHLGATLLALAQRLDDDESIERGTFLSVRITIVPLACWIGAIAFTDLDPFGAFTFFID